MIAETIVDNFWFSHVVLPILIFFARILDVSIGTLRIILISKGHKRLAPLLGFFEVLIWIVAISQIMQNLNNWTNYFAYAAGFATGNYIGMLIEEKIALGNHILRIITEKDITVLIHDFQQAGYGTTIVEGHSSQGPVSLVFVLFQRKKMQEVEAIIAKNIPNSFYSIEDVRHIKYGIFPNTTTKQPKFKSPFNRLRKGK
ncbi:MAG TPA: DUF2179 domain-containing protein [Salinivirgaceae bacterium]|nr:DUF2179 domain-containing protein [Salinivirgaceae bacterium]